MPTEKSHASTVAGQLELAYRASRIASLLMANERLRSLSPAQAWPEDTIANCRDLDEAQELIYGALHKAGQPAADTAATACASPQQHRAHSIEASLRSSEFGGQDLRRLFDYLGLSCPPVHTASEKVDLLMQQDHDVLLHAIAKTAPWAVSSNIPGGPQLKPYMPRFVWAGPGPVSELISHLMGADNQQNDHMRGHLRGHWQAVAEGEIGGFDQYGELQLRQDAPDTPFLAQLRVRLGGFTTCVPIAMPELNLACDFRAWEGGLEAAVQTATAAHQEFIAEAARLPTADAAPEAKWAAAEAHEAAYFVDRHATTPAAAGAPGVRVRYGHTLYCCRIESEMHAPWDLSIVECVTDGPDSDTQLAAVSGSHLVSLHDTAQAAASACITFWESSADGQRLRGTPHRERG